MHGTLRELGHVSEGGKMASNIAAGMLYPSADTSLFTIDSLFLNFSANESVSCTYKISDHELQ